MSWGKGGQRVDIFNFPLRCDLTYVYEKKKKIFKLIILGGGGGKGFFFFEKLLCYCNHIPTQTTQTQNYKTSKFEFQWQGAIYSAVFCNREEYKQKKKDRTLFKLSALVWWVGGKGGLLNALFIEPLSHTYTYVHSLLFICISMQDIHINHIYTCM